MPLEVEKKTPEQIIKTEIGKPFRPFEGLVKLLAPDEGQEPLESFYMVASTKIEFKGIEMFLALMPVRNISEIHINFHDGGFDTPLGKVPQEIVYVDNRSKQTKAPLQIGLLSTMDRRQFNIAREYQLKIKVGDETYYVLCPEDVSFDDADNADLTLKRLREEILPEAVSSDDADTDGKEWENRKNDFINDKLIGEDGKPIQVLLPYDPKKLSTIEVTIIRKG